MGLADVELHSLCTVGELLLRPFAVANSVSVFVGPVALCVFCFFWINERGSFIWRLFELSVYRKMLAFILAHCSRSFNIFF